MYQSLSLAEHGANGISCSASKSPQLAVLIVWTFLVVVTIVGLAFVVYLGLGQPLLAQVTVIIALREESPSGFVF